MSNNMLWVKVPMSRRRFLQTSVAAGIATAAGGLGLSGGALAADSRVLRARTYADMTTVDSAFSAGVMDEERQGLIWNKLVSYTPGRKWGWRLEAAEEMKQVSPTRIAFKLRQGMKWSNGYGEMTAEDVKFSFERVIDPALESPLKPDWGPLDHVEVTGKYSGEIVLKKPFAPLWLITLPYSSGNIMCKKAVMEAGTRLTTETPTVGGPYRIREWKPKQVTVFERNPEWTGAKPAYDEIQLLTIDDEKTAEIGFEAGDIDFTRISLASLGQFQDSPPSGATIEKFPSLFYVWVGMNLDNPAMANKKLRQAIQHAIDVPSIMDAAYFGAAEPSTGIIAPGLPGNRPKSLVPPEANFDKARALMKESGISGPVKLTLDVLNKSTNVTTAQIIQATLAEIGVEVQINLLESGAFWSLGDGNGEAWKDVQLILNRFSMTPDPYYATSWFITEQVGKWNWERFSNPEFDKLHEAAMVETDVQKRAEMYRKAQDLMEESGAYRFLTHEATPMMWRKDVTPALRPDGLPLYRYFS